MRLAPALVLAAAVLTACGDRPAAIPDIDPAPASSTPPAVTDAPATVPNFGPWKDRLDELLTPELAAAASGLPAEAANVVNVAGADRISYSWASDREQDYAGMRLSKKNRVSLGSIRTGVTPAFFHGRFAAVAVAGVGDAAIWQTGEHDQILHVLLNGTAIEIAVDISDDRSANRDAAVALAQQIIARL